MTPNQKNSDEVCETPAAESNVQLEPHTATLGEALGTVLENLHGAEQALQAAQQQRQHPSGSIVVIAAPAAQQVAPWQGIPQELRERAQWCVAGADKRPLTASGRAASVTDPTTWGSFEAVCAYASGHGLHIGYVLHESDPFTCIDLDVKDTTTQAELERYWRIVQAFDSYTEFSRSGEGYHIWVQGTPNAGCRRDGVEVYSRERFIICTGNAVIDKPIAPRPELLNMLVSEIRAAQATTAVELVEVGEAEPDEAIWQRGADAVNGDKFRRLWDGKWSAMGYPSQSEADLALLSMLAFYTKSNEQVRRLFRISGLGQRDKATKDNRYIDRTLANIRGRQEREDERAASIEAKCAGLVQQVRATSAAQPGHLGNPIDQPQHAAPAASSAAQLAWPPGVAGQLAHLIYQHSMRPVPEVSIVAALGLLAGVCGKRWTIPKSGLNLYLVLLARSGIGKEAMPEGISMFIHAIKAKQPGVSEFFDFNEYASGQGLSKAVAMRNCFVQVSSEFGRRLKRMSEASDKALQDLRTSMTKLYSKSGQQAIVGGITYSDKEKNVDSVNGVAFSMVGDSTPDTFRESITDDMMEDGFLSRFTIVEYEGDRLPENENPLMELPADWAVWFTELVTHAITLDRNNNYQEVARDQSAAQLLAAFNLECDRSINLAADDNSRRQMWNRAHLKALRIAALLAVADNWMHPCMTTVHAEWAISLIRRDIAVFTKRLRSGDIGDDDKARETKVLAIIRKYISEEPKPGYKVPPELHKNGIVPRAYLQRRTSSLPAFKKHKMGATIAIEQVLRSLCSSGYVTKCDSAMMVKTYDEHGDCYKVLDLPQDE